MKPAPFDLVRPASLDEAVRLMVEAGDEGKVLAGGQSLVPLLALRLARFSTLVDLNRVEELDYIRTAGNEITIGAMTRQATIEHDPLIARELPLLARATAHIGHFQIRNRGTIGGALSHADPAAESPAVALALDARMTVVGPGGTRTVPARDFFLGPLTSALDDDEILESVSFPLQPGASGAAVREIARRSGDFATVGALAAVTTEDGRLSRISVVLFGVGPTPQRLELDDLIGSSVADLDRRALADRAMAAVHPSDDIHAAGEYRRHLAGVLTPRVIGEALAEATA